MKIFISALIIFFSPHLWAACLQAPAFFDNNRIYMKVSSPKGPLLFYTDSGGGVYPFIYSETAEKLGMKIEKVVEDDGIKIGFSTFPSSLETQNVPSYSEWKGNVKVFTARENAQDEPSQIKFFIRDGFYGATFFAAGKIWRFNYPKQELWFCDSFSVVKDFVVLDMYFKTTQGIRDTHQPRMEIEVSGTKVPVLFDTGATSLYSSEAVVQLKLNNQINPSSFIRESVARKWQQSNPKWRVIKNGDKFGGGGFLIEVPRIKVATYEVGPVWFATRKDSIYDKYSKEIMDAHIDGAVGGNLFKYFEIIANYPSAKLYFRK